MRALPAFPVSFQPDAVLHADDEPVQLATPDGQVEPWVLRADESCDLDHDVEAGWQAFSHPEPDGAE
ncbi:hypothetical protein [Amycolatopsis sp. lyj-23]|uniref:hypothetical protein n=1 Tax=Amycolatopsis sp. lyj-23 TaxID=2789283 RepID=UPI00397DBD0A